jgi:hypothetical protein
MFKLAQYKQRLCNRSCPSSQFLKTCTAFLFWFRQHLPVALIHDCSAAYRNRFLAYDARNAQFAIALICVAIQVYAALIEVWPKAPTPQASITFKCAIIGYAVWTLWRLGRVRRFTTSIGFTLMAKHDQAIVTGITRADAALYRAKHNGRDRVEWEPTPQP